MVRFAHDFHLLGNVAPGEFHLIDLAVFVDLDGEPLGKGVDHRRAHAVEAARDLIAPAAELASRVEDGIDHLQGGLSGLGLDVHGDAPAVVHHGDGVPGVNLDQDFRAEARQGLVNGVVHDLIDQVMEARSGGGADIHAGPLPHGLQALQNLDFRGVVLVGRVDRGGI